jgi:fused signal recognition particle receptor
MSAGTAKASPGIRLAIDYAPLLVFFLVNFLAPRELMDELAKVRRVLGRLNPAAPHDVVLVLDATNGQNALQQIEIFKEVAGVTGLIMTKLDGTARGGVLVAAAEQYGLPIHAIGVGEKIDDLRPFDPDLVARVIAGVVR